MSLPFLATLLADMEMAVWKVLRCLVDHTATRARWSEHNICPCVLYLMCQSLPCLLGHLSIIVYGENVPNSSF